MAGAIGAAAGAGGKKGARGKNINERMQTRGKTMNTGKVEIGKRRHAGKTGQEKGPLSSGSPGGNKDGGETQLGDSTRRFV